MKTTYRRLDEPLPVKGLWAVPVPWQLVPKLAAHPAARQFAASLSIDRVGRRAVILLWPGVDPRYAVAFLAKLAGQRRSRAG
jgi:hypothetical protein